MQSVSLVLAIVLGVVQGIFEWLPISSEGNVTLVLTALGQTPRAAVDIALFLHLGTAFAATIYFRSAILDALGDLPHLTGRTKDTVELEFLLQATLISGVTGMVAYETLVTMVTTVDGGILILLIGGLLIITGLFQWSAEQNSLQQHGQPTRLNALLVGVGQGLAILPGISRSGTTVGILLLRDFAGDDAFRLSFLLSIPAALGASTLAVVESGGLPTVSLLPASAALVVSGGVGYLTVGGLMRVAERVSFWLLCVGLGVVAVIGGALTVL